jgi:hypothetical protein
VITLSHLVDWDAEVDHGLASHDLQALGAAPAEVFGVVGWV